MAAGVDMEDTTILPNIMQLLLSNAIKPHPKIRYFILFYFIFIFIFMLIL